MQLTTLTISTTLPNDKESSGSVIRNDHAVHLRENILIMFKGAIANFKQACQKASSGKGIQFFSKEGLKE